MRRIRIAFVKFNMDDKKGYLFEYPRNGYLNSGDEVIVENKKGEETKVFVDTTEMFNTEYETDRNELRRLLLAAGVELPLKRVIAKVQRLNYEEDENEE